ncbi:integrase [Zhengella mangrovi]|uniref:Integrase n=1 Tax=Zhengella mangrovi TaxID=1982044 RepID=A0A2G1QGH9_9HYPH|nr:site-specific integrase [Zhengella mangrovi]PHP64571.1 integrase [Zhengella mangrovi]
MIYNALNPMKAKNLAAGKYADGQGLWLVKRSKGAGKWILRIVVGGKRREMGLGPWPDVAVAEARERASESRRKLRDGIDPIGEREAANRKTKRLTVAEAISSCFKARQAELKGDGKAGRWMSPLSTHVIPNIGKMAVEDIDQHVLKQVLEPVWHDKPDSARKAMNRINLTLKHAAALGLDVDLQSTMKARALLGKQRHEAQHIPSMPWKEAPSFYGKLSDAPYQMTCLALRFLMLTALRTSELRFATHSEIENDILVIPAGRTKTGAEHRVPLNKEMRTIIETARHSEEQKLLFPSSTGKAMSDATMARHMEREGLDFRPHGFRATFRTWAEEQTDAEYEVKETVLGHKVGTSVERAYQRSDLLEKRKALLESWAEFLVGKQSAN